MADSSAGLRQRGSSSKKSDSQPSRPKEAAPAHRQKDVSDASEPLNRTLILILLAIRLISARINRIEDCDETFNYWEASHFLQHGYGLQTWEYSPVYAIRSWSYAGLHAVLGVGFELVTLGLLGKTATFYFIRTVLAFFSASSEIYLARKVSEHFGSEAANQLLAVLAGSAGMALAAPAYLPSSFAMYTTTFAFASSLDSPSWNRTLNAVLWFAFGAVVGWPFAAALALPFALEELLGGITKVGTRLAGLVRAGLIAAVIILIPLVAIDSFFYRKFVIVPLQIVLYNVFGGDLGPDLYGTAAWHYYSANLLLNFNVIYLFAVASVILVPLTYKLFGTGSGSAPLNKTLVKLASFYIWTAIFTAQPHKEERFMFVIYPLLCFNAVMCLGAVEKLAMSLFGRKLARLAIWTVIVGSGVISALRVGGLYAYYQAPMEVYSRLGDTVRQDARAGRLTPGRDVSVCVGKEWYRFPTHYFLPQVTELAESNERSPRIRLKFLKSSFGGLLPKDFLEDQQGEPWRRGSFVVPSGMNNENREEMDRYVEPSTCDYIVDLNLPEAPKDHRDPDYLNDKSHWSAVYCLPFLDKDRTKGIARILWLPRMEGARVWGQYCLLARRS